MSWLAQQAKTSPDRVALLVPEGSISFAALDAMVAAAVGRLTEMGVGPGDRVAVWGESRVETVVAMWAVPRLGAVTVPLNTRASPEEAGRQVAHAGAELALVASDAPELGVESMELGALSGGRSSRGRPHRPDDLHSIVYTSGTAGLPKGVMLTWGNLEASTQASASFLGNRPGDRWLGVLPLFHVAGASILWRSAREGGTVVLEPGFEASRVAHLFASGVTTFASLVPTMLLRVLERHGGPFPRLRAVLVGGGPIAAELVDWALDAGLPVAPSYGLTETASQVVTLPPGEARRRPGAAGRPLPGVELRVVGEGRVPSRGEIGEIQIRGPMVSPGYVGEPPRQRGAWLATNDLGWLDDEGYLTVVGRSDEVIITGGEKVHAGQVEAVLVEHPAVAEAAVYGEGDPEWGEVVVAEVVPAGPGADPAVLAEHVRQRLGSYQVPRRWHFVLELPRTSLGKLDRARLGRDRSP